jgi:thiol-disulfide isomerase/thioredoxin
MRHPRWQVWLLAGAWSALLGASGCSSVRNPFGRPEVNPGVRTITTVGGSPETVVAGMPGDSRSGRPLAADAGGRSTGRISGRVVDSQGRPIANAEVRLAEGSRTLERDSRVITDEGGGFTLSGLRPGKTHTLIARNDGDRPLAGRALTEAPDSSLEIVLLPERRIVGNVSNRSEIDPLEDDDSRDGVFSTSGSSRGSARVNEDDLPHDDEYGPSRSNAEVKERSAEPADAWQPLGALESDSHTRVGGNSGDDFLVEQPSSAMGLPIDHNDGPNPLPPALEHVPGMAGRDPRSGAGSDGASNPPLQHSPRTDSEVNAADTFTAGEGPLVTEFPSTDDAPAPQQVATPEASEQAVESNPDTPSPASPGAESSDVAGPDAGPVVESIPLPPASPVDDKSESAGPSAHEETPLPPTPTATFDQQPELPAGPATPATTAPNLLDSPDDDSGLPEEVSTPSAHVVPPAAGRFEQAPTARLEDPDRPTWRQLSQQKLAENTLIYPRSVRRVVSGSTRRTEPNASTARAADRADSSPRGSVARATCSFDARKQRLVDFELPDLGGNAVRFKDIDADYILIDFWGTWCGPCVASVPHLVDLQTRYDPSRLRILGIAYEEGSPAGRARLVRAAASELGINYPLLLGEQDGKPCPLQSALNVTQFPTMVLLDRHGRILWRDSGSKPATLERLDRVIAANTRATADILRR